VNEDLILSSFIYAIVVVVMALVCCCFCYACLFFEEVMAVFSSLFARHRYPLGEKLFSVFVFMAGLSLHWVEEKRW